MGQPKFPRKQYDTPLHPWKEERIKQERELIKKYGLKNHKEVWRAKTYLGKYRQQARELLARMGSRDPQIKREGDQLLFHLTRMGILPRRKYSVSLPATLLARFYQIPEISHPPNGGHRRLR